MGETRPDGGRAGSGGEAGGGRECQAHDGTAHVDLGMTLDGGEVFVLWFDFAISDCCDVLSMHSLLVCQRY
jgi:hypothetical protein